MDQMGFSRIRSLRFGTKPVRTGVQTLLEIWSKNSSPSGFSALWISLLQYQFIIPCSVLTGYNPFITTSMQLKIIICVLWCSGFLVRPYILDVCSFPVLSFCYSQCVRSSPGHHPAPAPPASPAADWLWLEADLEVAASRFFPGCCNPVLTHWARKGEQGQGLWLWGCLAPWCNRGTGQTWREWAELATSQGTGVGLDVILALCSFLL